MSRASALRAVLTAEPASTSELYRRVGYATLAQFGLIPYAAFRAELARLSVEGVAESDTAHDGATVWRLASPLAEPPLDA
jgi:hypothetical protein